MLLADELATRLLPIGLDEGAYARNRDPAERPPYPTAGDEVYFRRNEWDSDGDLWLMRVVAVQDPDDKTSEWAPNLWQQIRDNLTGAPILGQIVPVADPWPWVHLRYEGDIGEDSPTWLGNIQMTFESRVRGAPGWLPLDYRQTRRLHVTGQIVARPLVAHGPGGSAEPSPGGGW
jgi:hypothetical protein